MDSVRFRASVTKLNHLVVEALLEAGVPAVGVSPCGFWTTSDRQVDFFKDSCLVQCCLGCDRSCRCN